MSELDPRLISFFADELSDMEKDANMVQAILKPLKAAGRALTGSNVTNAQRHLDVARRTGKALTKPGAPATGVLGKVKQFFTGAPKPAMPTGAQKAIQAAEQGVQTAKTHRMMARGAAVGIPVAAAGATGLAAAGTAYGLHKMRQPPQQQPEQPQAKMGSLASSPDEQRRRRHLYYIQNRQKMMQKRQAYYAGHRAELLRKKKIYQRRVKSGARRQRRRISTGSMSYGFMGYK